MSAPNEINFLVALIVTLWACVVLWLLLTTAAFLQGTA